MLFPQPFGPIIPVIDPRVTVMEISTFAFTPPKAFDTPMTSIRLSAIRRLPL